MGKLKNVVFLDRDGVINRDSPDYIKSWEEFEFLPGSIEAIRCLTAAGYPVIVITNQSVIGRQMTSPEELDRIFTRMQQVIKAGGGGVLDIFHCPHLPEDNCDCRKPRPGLILQAVETYGVDLSTAGFIGDSAKDILCARAAGCAFSILVESGKHPDAAKARLAELGIIPDQITKNLFDAAGWIIENFGKIDPDAPACPAQSMP